MISFEGRCDTGWTAADTLRSADRDRSIRRTGVPEVSRCEGDTWRVGLSGASLRRPAT